MGGIADLSFQELCLTYLQWCQAAKREALKLEDCLSSSKVEYFLSSSQLSNLLCVASIMLRRKCSGGKIFPLLILGPKSLDADRIGTHETAKIVMVFPSLDKITR